MVKFTARDDVRDAYRAGLSGARQFSGTGDAQDAFQRGRRSARDFRNNRRFSPTRSTYGRNTGKTFITKAADKAGDKLRDIYSGAEEGIMGAYDAMMKAGKQLFVDPMMKAAENRKIMGDALNDNVRMSMMTDQDKEFYDKYMRLADLTSDQNLARQYRDTANTAMRNAQISSRINYGLGQLGYDTIGKEGFDSYKQPMFDEGSPRFNMDNFMSGLGSSSIGKAFLAEAQKAQSEEEGGTPISNAMKEFTFGGRGTFSSDAERYPQIPGGIEAQNVSIEDIPTIETQSNNVASMYPNLNIPFLQNKYFPNTDYDDITLEQILELPMKSRLALGYNPNI